MDRKLLRGDVGLGNSGAVGLTGFSLKASQGLRRQEGVGWCEELDRSLVDCEGLPSVTIHAGSLEDKHLGVLFVLCWWSSSELGRKGTCREMA